MKASDYRPLKTAGLLDNIREKYRSEIPADIFEDIKLIVRSSSGLDIGNYKDKCIKRRIAVRVRARGCDSARDYIRILKSDDSELDKLLGALTINVTQFFRNPSAFKKIKEVVFPKIFEEKAKNGGAYLRVWSVGCSSGEEPYSIAILLKNYFADAIGKLTVSIMATDFDDEAINKGREGVYEEKSLVEVEPAILEKYFLRQFDGRYCLSNDIKRMVTFKKRNILTEKIYREQDIIICRNMLIYLSRDEQKRIIERLSEALAEKSYLVLGKAETLMAENRKIFDTLCPRERIYQKI